MMLVRYVARRGALAKGYRRGHVPPPVRRTLEHLFCRGINPLLIVPKSRMLCELVFQSNGRKGRLSF